MVPDAATVSDVGVTVAGAGFVTVTVALVASFDHPLLANRRTSHVVAAAGAANVIAAAVSPVVGAVFELLRYFQSTYVLSALVAGQNSAIQSATFPGPPATLTVMVLDATTVSDVGVTVATVGGAPATVTVVLVASFDHPWSANRRTSHDVAAAGATNVIVAAVTPMVGAVLELLRYFQSM